MPNKVYPVGLKQTIFTLCNSFFANH